MDKAQSFLLGILIGCVLMVGIATFFVSVILLPTVEEDCKQCHKDTFVKLCQDMEIIAYRHGYEWHTDCFMVAQKGVCQLDTKFMFDFNNLKTGGGEFPFEVKDE